MCSNIRCVYEVCISPTLNRSSAIQHIQPTNAIIENMFIYEEKVICYQLELRDGTR